MTAIAWTSGLIAGAQYVVYDKRMHRPIPATSKDTEDRDSFYQDQYRDRDRRLQRENEQWKQSREQRERELRQRLLAEQQALLSQTKDENSTWRICIINNL